MDRSTELHLDYRTVLSLGCSMDRLMEFHLDHSMELCMGSLMDWSIDKNVDIKILPNKISKVGEVR